jgi:hypothetical protein
LRTNPEDCRTNSFGVVLVEAADPPAVSATVPLQPKSYELQERTS